MAGNLRVLHVAPDRTRREAVAAGLSRVADGPSVVGVDTASAALDRLDGDGEAFDCVLVDAGVTGPEGWPFPVALRAAGHDHPVVLVGGNREVTPEAVAATVPEWALPEDVAVLADRIREAVAADDGGGSGDTETGGAGEGVALPVDAGGVVEAATDLVATVDAEGRVVHASTAAGELLGVAPADLVGRPVAEAVYPPDRAAAVEAVAALIADPGEPLAAALRLADADGDPVPVEARGVAVPGAGAEGARSDGAGGGGGDGDGGEVARGDGAGVGAGVEGPEGTRVVLFAREPADPARDRTFEALVRHSSDVVTLLDADGTVRYESPAARQVKGLDPGTVEGERVWRFVHPEDIDRVRAVLAAVADDPGGVSESVEYRLRDGDGEYRWMESVGSNPGPDADVGGVVVNTRNVTDRVERDYQLRVLDRVFRHNVRNDLGVVMGWAELLRDDPGAVDAAEAADRILGQCRSLMGTVDKQRETVGLLTDPPDRTTVDCSAAVRRAVDRIRKRFPEADVEVTCPEGVTARAVPSVERAILELVENAVEHASTSPRSGTPGDAVERGSTGPHPETGEDAVEDGTADGPVTVSVERSGDDVVVTVADRGPGLPVEEADVLLNAADVDQLRHGSGMGLWLVYWIVRQSEGELALEPGDDGGTAVAMTFEAAD